MKSGPRSFVPRLLCRSRRKRSRLQCLGGCRLIVAVRPGFLASLSPNALSRRRSLCRPLHRLIPAPAKSRRMSKWETARRRHCSQHDPIHQTYTIRKPTPRNRSYLRVFYDLYTQAKARNKSYPRVYCDLETISKPKHVISRTPPASIW